ncbi:hypothetical protein [Methanoplanus endosymbiosus]|uniref:Uncharacterized protein n=1 Tax=Methanoplanus endosymbiosus TaxID=33865 RepID=A0A9E7TI31_9EURY|nr:hypothetical protein [Methanoplanus endosymbiosus]UUX91798.1 hypothetical protein L6E24_10545 [Methanoplanus endosymbiosus]
MNSNEAVQAYLFGENSKVNLITASQTVPVISGLKGAEKSGAKKVLFILLDSYWTQLNLAGQKTGFKEFGEAADLIDKAKKQIEIEDFDDAVITISMAITKCTTPAQSAWAVLSENELI